MSETSIAFVVAFLIGASLAIARHPFFGLLTYVGVFYLSPADRWWGEGWVVEVRWSLLAAGVTLLGLLIHRRKIQPATFWGRGPVVGMLAFIAWLAVQLLWALDRNLQIELLTMYGKFLVAMLMIYRCIDSFRTLRVFLWAHVLGCFYFGIIAFTSHMGGRFEGFGGPGLDDANAGALALATGVLAGAGIFLAGQVKEKLAITLTIPFILNGLVATVSRSGFLAIAIGGAIFNLVPPKRFRLLVHVLSVLGVVLILLVTSPTYWARMASIRYAGQQLEDVDTGAGRSETIHAQWRMFRNHPLGCGHRCTALLSSSYLDDRFLTGEGSNRGRSSHNTFMSLLVEQGIPGAVFYFGMLYWLAKSQIFLWRKYSNDRGRDGALFPAIAAVLGAITVGDLFVDYLKFEIRIWFVALMMLAISARLVDSRPVSTIPGDSRIAGGKQPRDSPSR